jgi:hypothetical protein
MEVIVSNIPLPNMGLRSRKRYWKGHLPPCLWAALGLAHQARTPEL